MTNFTLIQSIDKVVLQVITHYFKLQGHNLTGNFLKSIEQKIKKTTSGTNIEYYFENYGNIVDTGVKKERIPYGGRRGKATRSKYIEGLTRYALLRFRVSQAEALRIAFAIATKHKKEGMPTKSSGRYSQNGERTGFLDKSLKDIEKQIEPIITMALGKTIETIIERSTKQI